MRRRARWRAAVASSALVLGACGGNVDHRQDEGPMNGATAGAGPAGAAGAGAGGGGGGGAAGAGATSTEGPGCPEDAWYGECPQRLVVELDLSGGTRPIDGVWAEPLQLPNFDGILPGRDPATPKEPADWDRSEVPAGACVFRLHGTQLSCLGADASMNTGACGNTEPVVPASFYEYEHCADGVAPGCPSENPWVGAREGWAWYFRPTDDGEIHVVLCSGLCRALLGGKSCLNGYLD